MPCRSHIASCFAFRHLLRSCGGVIAVCALFAPLTAHDSSNSDDARSGWELAEQETVASTSRVTVAIPGFENRSGDVACGYWSVVLPSLLAEEIAQVRTVRLSSGVEFALREVGLRDADPVDDTQARRIGQVLGVQWIVWGSYCYGSGGWKVNARVLRVSDGEVWRDISAISADWFEVTARLADQVLRQSGAGLGNEVRGARPQAWTTSAAALDWYARAEAAARANQPWAEAEKFARRATQADPRFAEAYALLAEQLLDEGRIAEAGQAARQALGARAGLAPAHQVLGEILQLRGTSTMRKRNYRLRLILIGRAAGRLKNSGRFMLRPATRLLQSEASILLSP